ncbi:MAG: insulinase family protein [Acidimicrobiia bacterium]|nr:insulinase family protein [Acidimicrobiia bacterium]
MGDTELTRLPGGLRVVTRRLPGARAASVGAWIGVGSRDESPARSGTSHFLEHLLFKGTRTRSAHDLAVAVDSVGGEMNAFTTRELTAYYARVPGVAVGAATEMLLDVVTDPLIDADDVESERAVILDEIRVSTDEPEDRAQTLLYESLFPADPLGRDVGGSVDTVEALTRDEIAEFHHANYRRGTVVVAAAGAVDHDAIVEQAERSFGPVSSGTTPSRVAPPPETTVGTVEHRDLEEVHLVLGWRGFGHHDPDRHALAVGSQLLGGGLSSRLFQEVREKRGLAYSIFSSPVHFSDSGAFVIATGTSPQRVDEVMKVIESEVADVAGGGVTETEVEIAKRFLEGSTELAFEDSWSHLSHIAHSVTSRDRVVDIGEYLDAIRAVTVDDVNRVLGTMLAAEPSVTSVGPIAGAGPD